jgi:hypothetical protein
MASPAKFRLTAIRAFAELWEVYSFTSIPADVVARLGWGLVTTFVHII